MSVKEKNVEGAIQCNSHTSARTCVTQSGVLVAELGLKFKKNDSCGRDEEYILLAFDAFCKHEIVHKRSASYTPHLNRLAGRKHRILVDMVNAIVLNVDSSNLWSEVLLTASYGHNTIACRKNTRTPYEL